MPPTPPSPAFVFQPRKPPQRRPRASAPATPPGVALTLVTAVYDESQPAVVLEFDRAVDVAAFDGAAIIVRDGGLTMTAYVGAADPTLDLPNMVRISLDPTGAYAGPEIDLTATGATGIVAADDGGTWGGTGGVLVLPYP